MDMVSIERAAPGRTRVTHGPGEPGVWLLVGGELVVFTILFAAFVTVWSDHPGAFASAAQTSLVIGTLNTVLLLTSSAIVATGVHAARAGRIPAARRCVRAAASAGWGFVVLKAVEYGIEWTAGMTPATSPFWMYYYAITGLHLAHVLIGLALLGFALRALSDTALPSARALQHLESSATYWHMVDVLWIVIFALVYLAAR